MITITIDPNAGFCPGVTKAINLAGKLLEDNTGVYSLGELVHCPEELNRLEGSGLKIMSLDDLNDVNHSTILIRAHGVTPDTQYKLQISNNEVVDATCRIVQNLQQKIKISSLRLKSIGGQVIIFGKRKHPEVEGLVGYCYSKVVIVEKADDISGIDLNSPMDIFAQTTVNVADFERFISVLYARLKESGINDENVQIFNTICGSIKHRVPNLKLFARDNDAIIFVSGEQSSNGAYLSSISKEVNANTYKISDEKQLKPKWFEGVQKIGVTGAASTPIWLLEKVAAEIEHLMSRKPE